MKKARGGLFVFSIFLEVIMLCSTVGISAYLLGDKSFAVFAETPIPVIVLVCWIILLILTASLVYQSWGCIMLKNNILIPSNWETNPAIAITYIAINTVSILFASLLASRGCVLWTSTPSLAPFSAMHIADWSMLLIMLTNFSWQFYSQLRRNSVRDFIQRHKGTFKDVLTATKALNCL